MIKNNIDYPAITDLLVGDSQSVEELTILLNFINRIGSVINHLLHAQKIKLENMPEEKCNGDK